MAQETLWDVDVAGPGTRTVWDRDLAGPGTETRWDLLPEFLGRGLEVVWGAMSNRIDWLSPRYRAKW